VRRLVIDDPVTFGVGQRVRDRLSAYRGQVTGRAWARDGHLTMIHVTAPPDAAFPAGRVGWFKEDRLVLDDARAPQPR
jgi:hypothetical protein